MNQTSREGKQCKVEITQLDCLRPMACGMRLPLCNISQMQMQQWPRKLKPAVTRCSMTPRARLFNSCNLSCIEWFSRQMNDDERQSPQLRLSQRLSRSMSPKPFDNKLSKATQSQRNNPLSAKEKGVRPSPLGQPSTKVLLLLL